MSKIEFDYYYGAEAEQFTFIRVPKVLFTDKEHFGSLSNEAKLMYGLLLERMSLSRKNNWIDDENRVYIIFLIEEIEEIMDVCHDKALNILKELDDVNGIGLVKKKRRGLGLPSILYVKNFIINESDSLQNGKQDNTDNSEHTSRSLKNGFLEVDKTDTNNTEINNTDLSYTDYQSINQSASPHSRLIDEIDRETLEQSVKEQIEYDNLITHPDEAVVSMVEEIKDLIVDVISGERNIFVEGKKISEEAARSAYRKLTSEHITDVLRNILNYPGKISRIDRFLTAALYNSAFTLTNQTFSGFEHDMGMKLI